METVVTVKEIRGHCPTYKVGDSFALKAGYQLVSDIPVCMHALAALMPYYNALRVCVSPIPLNGGWTAKKINPRLIFNARIHSIAPTAVPSSLKFPNNNTVILLI